MYAVEDLLWPPFAGLNFTKGAPFLHNSGLSEIAWVCYKELIAKTQALGTEEWKLRKQ